MHFIMNHTSLTLLLLFERTVTAWRARCIRPHFVNNM